MAFENINLDELAEAIHKDSYGDRSKNMVYNQQTGKWEVIPANQPIPSTGVVANGMTREGFAA
jgi:hypothetical protein